MNVPKLRFKEFNDEWIETKIQNVATVIGGGTPSTDEPKYWGNEINWFTPSEIGKTKYVTISNRKISQDGLKNSSAKLLPKGTILLSSRATVGEASILLNEASTNQGFQSLIVNENNCNEFIYYLKYKYKREMLIKSFGSTFLEISKSNVENIKIKIPSKEEQFMIANFLSLLDKKIELQTKKIEDLKLFKKGLINNIGKNIEIEKIPLKNILTEQNHKTIRNNEYEILSSTSKGLYLQKDYFNKQAASDNNVGYKILKKNQLVLSPQNLWMGNININSKYNIGIVSPSYKIFDINNNIDIDFFDYWIKSPKALYEYKISSEQGASIVRRNLNIDLFYEIKVDIPKGKMQNKIGKIIKLLNLKILYNENSLQKLQELKKGLMQNMFV